MLVFPGIVNFILVLQNLASARTIHAQSELASTIWLVVTLVNVRSGMNSTMASAKTSTNALWRQICVPLVSVSTWSAATNAVVRTGSSQLRPGVWLCDSVSCRESVERVLPGQDASIWPKDLSSAIVQLDIKHFADLHVSVTQLVFCAFWLTDTERRIIFGNLSKSCLPLLCNPLQKTVDKWQLSIWRVKKIILWTVGDVAVWHTVRRRIFGTLRTIA